MSTNHTGAKGEQLAAKHLAKQGHKIIATNYHYKRFGEIDIITIKDDVLHFVEVKTRYSNSHGYGYESVDQRKLSKLLRTAQAFMAQCSSTDHAYQFDIVSIILSDETVEHYENITQ